MGRWLSDQRRGLRAGQMNGERAEELDALGIVWDTGDQTFAENLAAARAYFAEACTLAAPRHATALDKPVGRWLTNIRRPGGWAKTRYAPTSSWRSIGTGTPRRSGGRWIGSVTTSAWLPC
ncbi:helicase associated domain-containing protein [Streptomyces sp. NPDC006692]|uniref:helicase associated domain-containing protein n=1 Tax=Streptomyces sp. NPDC006692 TaxID=3364758 RepID=UPI00368770D0